MRLPQAMPVHGAAQLWAAAQRPLGIHDIEVDLPSDRQVVSVLTGHIPVFLTLSHNDPGVINLVRMTMIARFAMPVTVATSLPKGGPAINPWPTARALAEPSPKVAFRVEEAVFISVLSGTLYRESFEQRGSLRPRSPSWARQSSWAWHPPALLSHGRTQSTSRWQAS